MQQTRVISVAVVAILITGFIILYYSNISRNQSSNKPANNIVITSVKEQVIPKQNVIEKIIEKTIEIPVEKIVEKIIEKPCATVNSKSDTLSQFSQFIKNDQLEAIELTKQISSGDVKNPAVNLVTQLFGSMENDHYVDMLAAIQLNLFNPFVEKVHLLQENNANDQDLKKLIGQEKLVIHILGHRITVGDFMRYSNEKLPQKIVGLINTDVYFDNTLFKLHKMPQQTAYVISRKETLVGNQPDPINNRDQCAGYQGSHDAFIFRNSDKFQDAIIDKLNDINLGYMGTENVILYHLKRHGRYRVLNPCRSVNLFHLHRNRSNKEVKRINGGGISDTQDPTGDF